jgi:LysR family glycine cleavage system transcriptional activator
MGYKLPSLNALRAFEATSRHQSAKLAAEELHVTPAAISHQIKALESYLELKLFKRLNRQLVLTKVGREYSEVLKRIFEQLAIETKRITRSEKNTLTISVEPSFAMYWLIPRLHHFRKKIPNIELRVISSYDIFDFKNDDIDICIRWGNGRYPGLFSTLLFRNELFPVCSPKLIEKKPIKKPNDLRFHTLLHEATTIDTLDYPEWETWLAAAKADKVDPNSGLFFETGYLLIQAAIEGQGIAFERAAFVENALQSGLLVKPFSLSVKESLGGYFCVCQKDRKEEVAIQTVIKWLKSELK